MRFHRYAYLFVDGVNVAVRLGEDAKLCLLVVIGVREDGEKELLAVEDGYRESEDSWAAVFRDLRDRGMNAPKLVTGDGALGAWAALRNVFPGASGAALLGSQDSELSSTRYPSGCSHGPRGCCTRWPRRPPARTLARRWSGSATSSTRSTPRRSRSSTRTGTRSPRSTTSRPSTGGTYGRRTRSRSSFATVKLRTKVTKGAGSKKAALAMAYKLLDAAQERWRRFNGHELVTDVLDGVKFKDGIQVTDDDNRNDSDERVAA